LGRKLITTQLVTSCQLWWPRDPRAHLIPGAALRWFGRTGRASSSDLCDLVARRHAAVARPRTVRSVRVGSAPQHLPLGRRTRQPPGVQHLDHRRPVNDRQPQITDSDPTRPHIPGPEIRTREPIPMTDEQLNRCRGTRQSVSVKPQRRRQVIEVRSVSGVPSTKSTTTTSSPNSDPSPERE
jgi:hypothetical protein